jgi:uncharacterized phage protein (TIGR01671 family)|nr:MAG TPA: YopX protein [Caudoviricetes sp.]
MTREILFRGKRVDNGEWVEGFYACVLDSHYIITGRFDSLTNGIINSEAYEVTPETVGQFTGLTDRNGVKIFEGDIVRYGQRGKVEYNSGSAQFTLNFTNSTYEGFDKIPFCDCEVLGNIYDNPELLEVSGNE